MLQEGTGAHQRRRNDRGGLVQVGRRRGVGRDYADDGCHVRRRGGLVQGHGERGGGELAQAEPRGLGAGMARGDGGRGGIHANRIEDGGRGDAHARADEALRQGGGESGHAGRDGANAVGAVIDREHARHDRGQNLRGADVAGRLLAPDVLLAGLQGQAQCHAAVRVLRHAHQASGHLARVFLARGKERRVRSAVAERQAESLHAAQGHVGPELSGWGQHRKGEQIGRHRHARASGVGALAEGAVVEYLAVGGRVLQKGAEDARIEAEIHVVAEHDFEAQGRRAGAHHGDGLGMAKLRHEKDLGVVALAKPGEHVHGLGRRGGLIEQRGPCHVEPTQIHGHGLEIEQGLQAALRDLGLVGRVGSVPAGILQDVALDDRRQDGLGVAHADVGPHAAVAVAQPAQLGQGLVLGQRRRELKWPVGADGRGDRLRDQLVERGRAHDAQHLDQIRWSRADVAKQKLILWCGGHLAATSPRSLSRRSRRRRGPSASSAPRGSPPRFGSSNRRRRGLHSRTRVSPAGWCSP